MTISELIKNLPENLSAKDVRAAFKKSFLGSSRKYSEDEKALLSAFCGNRTKMDNNNEIRTWNYKNVDEGTLKELTQYINRGVTSNKSHTVKPYAESSSVSEFRNKVEAIIANSIHGAVPKKLGKDKPIPQEELKDYVFSDENVVYTVDGVLKEVMNPKEIEDYNKYEDRNFARDVYIAKDVIAELATFLAAESGVVDIPDGFAMHECEEIRSKIKEISAARKTNDCAFPLISVRTIKHIACAIADKVALNSGKPDPKTSKHFHDSQLQEAIDTQAREFTDIPFGFVAGEVAKETSNYNLGTINEYGDKEEFFNYDKTATLDALKGDKLGVVIDGVKKLADIVVEDDAFSKDQKMLVTDPKEGAIFSLVMLISTSASEIKNEPAEDLQKIYAPILAQCLDKLELENASAKEIVESAKAIVKELPITVDLEEVEHDDELELFDSEIPVREEEPVVVTPKKSKVSVKSEMSSFRKKLIKAIKDLERKRGLYKTRAMKKENPQRENSLYVKAILDIDQIGLNKNLKDFGQSLDDLLLDLPVEAKEGMPVPIVLEKIYSEIYSKGQQLQDETKDKEYTSEEKKQLREKYGLTNEGAKEMVERVYGEHFDNKGMLI